MELKELLVLKEHLVHKVLLVVLVEPHLITLSLLSTTNADPGTGNLRFNNATPASATALYIDASDDNSTVNLSAYLQTIDDSDINN
jgi:hypothetical protein